MRLTDEQAAFRDQAVRGSDIIATAGAGCGKTTTARIAAEAMLAAGAIRKGVFTTFTKSTIVAAREVFPSAIQCKTSHALALASPAGRALKHKFTRGKPTMADLVYTHSIENTLIAGSGGTPDRWVDAQTMARLGFNAVEAFMSSARDEISPRDVSRHVIPEQVDHDQFVTAILDVAHTLWRDYVDPRSPGFAGHNVYRKQWALERPTLRTDVVILDEAQDTAPVLARVIADQPCQKIVIGDAAQQLFGWTGAINALARILDDHPDAAQLVLSQSFRFGPAIAEIANHWLAHTGKPLRLKGWEAIESRVAGPDEDGGGARAVLCRTNVGAMSEVIDALDGGRKVALVGGGKEISSLAWAAKDLKAGRRTGHPDLGAYTSWEEVVHQVRGDEHSPLAPLVAMIERFGPDRLIDIVRRLVDEDRAEVTVSTTHKVKGREWETVRIANDFTRRVDEDEPDPTTVEDAMTAYVAVTRAQHVLYPGPLAPDAVPALTMGG